MGNSEEEEGQEATQIAATIRCGAIAQDEGCAVAEEEREEQVELAFGKGDDQESRDEIRGPLDRCLGEPLE